MRAITLWRGTLTLAPTDFGPVDTLLVDGVPRAWLIDHGDALIALRAVAGQTGTIAFIADDADGA